MFQSPQWGSNSKEIVKRHDSTIAEFQSPQWGSNSKEYESECQKAISLFQSPQWGSNSKVTEALVPFGTTREFQSPQWGSNSKATSLLPIRLMPSRFSPRNGEVILKGKPIKLQS